MRMDRDVHFNEHQNALPFQSGATRLYMYSDVPLHVQFNYLFEVVF